MKEARGSKGKRTSVMLVAVAVFIRANWKRAIINVSCCNYEKDHWLTEDLEPASGVKLHTLFNQSLLWAQSGYCFEAPRETLGVTRAQIEEVTCTMLVQKKSYVALV